jgi:isopenicillin N synthase-like dioxygenase
MQASNQETIDIPVIDISNAQSQTGEQIVNAVVKWGFVFIKAHGSGFTPEIIDNIFQRVSHKSSRL